MTDKIMKLFDFDPFPSTLPLSLSDSFSKIFKQLDGFDYDNHSWSLRGFPRGDIYQEEDKTIIELALAGYKKEQLSVKVDGSKLIVSADKCEKDGDSRTLARRAFTQEFFLNKTFDLEQTSVSFIDGLLQITVPKVKAEPKISKVIDIL